MKLDVQFLIDVDGKILITTTATMRPHCFRINTFQVINYINQVCNKIGQIAILWTESGFVNERQLSMSIDIVI